MSTPSISLVGADATRSTCVCRGVPPTSASSDPSTDLTLSDGEDLLHLRIRHCARRGVHTGGHIWSCSRHLACWLYDRRAQLSGLRVLELACGLALPSLVAARCGAAVTTTDELEPLLEHAVANAHHNACTLSPKRLDFTRRDDVVAIADESF